MNFKKRVNGSWADTPHYIHKTDTDTITTLPVVLYPTGTTATVGLKGQMEQSSQPSPTTPIQPQECGERTANLFDLSSYLGTSAGVSDIVINRNSITFNTSSQFLAIVYDFNLGTTDIYTLALGGDSFHTRLEIRYLKNGSTVGSAIVIQPNQHNTISGSDEYDGFRVYISNANNTGTCTASNIMLNEGSTALPFEPSGYKIPILSNNTTTSVYLGEVETTRKIVKKTFNGSESFSLGSVIGQIRFNAGLTLIDNAAICSHYILKETYSSTGKPYIRLRSNTVWFELDDTGYETKEACLADFITYLTQQYATGTPVTVWYALATPTTGIINEPIRKIGEYADTVSGISIPTIAGADTLSVGTTLQPSEVTVNYHGWHPVADVHERENGAWT